MNERILIIEDQPDIREIITYNLGKEGYRVTAGDKFPMIGGGAGEAFQ